MAKLQRIQFDPNTCIRVHHMTNRPPIFDWHKHDCFELILVCSGDAQKNGLGLADNKSGRKYLANQVSDIVEQELVIIPPYVEHTWDTELTAEHVVVVLLDKSFFDCSLPEIGEAIQWLSQLNSVISLSASNWKNETDWYEQIVKPLIQLKVQTALERLITVMRVVNSCAEHAPQTSSSTNSLLATDQDFIQQVMSAISDVTVRTLADCALQLNVSQSTLKRKLKQELGQSYSQLSRQIRVERAQSLLATTNLPLALVAERSGFTSVRAFNLGFKQATGVTPSKYRKQNRWRSIRSS